jgi:hypothetical protein
MILNQEGTLVVDGMVKRVGGRTKDAIELSADRLEQRSDLLDRVFAFDVVGLQTVELRIRTSRAIEHPHPGPRITCLPGNIV